MLLIEWMTEKSTAVFEAVRFSLEAKADGDLIMLPIGALEDDYGYPVSMTEGTVIVRNSQGIVVADYVLGQRREDKSIDKLDPSISEYLSACNDLVKQLRDYHTRHSDAVSLFGKMAFSDPTGGGEPSSVSGAHHTPTV